MDSRLQKMSLNLETDFDCDDGPPRAYLSEGKTYVTIKSDGTEEGQEPEVLFLSQQAALDAFEDRMKTYLTGKKKIWWRKRPEISVETDVWIMVPGLGDSDPILECRKRYRVRARLYAE